MITRETYLAIVAYATEHGLGDGWIAAQLEAHLKEAQRWNG